MTSPTLRYPSLALSFRLLPSSCPPLIARQPVFVCFFQQQDEVTLYGRRVTPTLEEALASPPPWQALAKEDETLQDVLIERLVAEEMAR